MSLRSYWEQLARDYKMPVDEAPGNWTKLNYDDLRESLRRMMEAVAASGMPVVLPVKQPSAVAPYVMKSLVRHRLERNPMTIPTEHCPSCGQEINWSAWKAHECP